jgi:hypothetical protein
MLKYAFNLLDDGLVGQQLFAGEATRLAYLTDEAVEGARRVPAEARPDWSPTPGTTDQRATDRHPHAQPHQHRPADGVQPPADPRAPEPPDARPTTAAKPRYSPISTATWSPARAAVQASTAPPCGTNCG